jgi:hypothetical protein
VIYPIRLISKTETFSLSQFLLKLEYSSFINYTPSSSHVGPDVGGLISNEEKLDQEVPGGPQATCFEELNPEQGEPRCTWRPMI